MSSRPYVAFLAAMLLCSCSTTRVLSEGQYRLASNNIRIEGAPELRSSEVSPYVKQQANSYFIFGWNPFLNVYNWSDPSSDKWIDRIWRKIGEAPVVYNPGLVEASKENIIKHLEYIGYYNSTVTSEVNTARKLAHVTYKVTPGPRSRIDSIVYDVPEGEFRKEFEADITNSLVHKGDWLSEELLEKESERGAEYFHNLGYYDFSKSHYFFVADTLGRKNILSYQIRNYSRNDLEITGNPEIRKYKIGKVSISHSDEVKIRENLLRKLNLIHPGSLYSEKMVNDTYTRFASLRVFNNVSIQLQPSDSATVDCGITLGESSLQGFKTNLEASTNSSGLIGISPQLSIYNKNIFHGGEWLSLGFTGNFQFKPKTDVKATEFGVSASLSVPHFLVLPFGKGANLPRTEFSANYNYQSRPEFTRHIGGFSYGYTGRSSSGMRYQIYPLKATFVRIKDIDTDFLYTIITNPYLWDSYDDHLDAGVGGVLYWTSNSDIVPKVSHHYERIGLDLSGNVLSLFSPLMPKNESDDPTIFGLPFSQYVRGEVTLGKTIRMGKDNSQALAFRFFGGIGYAYGYSTTMPFEKQFYVGGAGSMRGWQARALGPGFDEMESIFTIPSQTGDWKLEFDMEYRFPLFWKLEGALFAEAGNVWKLSEKYEQWQKSIASDLGLGLRVNLNFLVLRVDAGFKLYDPSKEESERWRGPGKWFRNDGFAVHFGVGYPF